MKASFTLFLTPLVTLLGVACGPLGPVNQATEVTPPETGYLAGIRAPQAYDSSTQNPNEASAFWDGDGVGGSPLIRINLREQTASYYKGGVLVGVSPISTGIKGRRTPKGRFKITQKSKDHKSSLYGVIRDVATGQVVNDDADTRKHRAKKGQVFERAPMPYFMRFNGGIGMHTGYLPGYAASHGCVRMPDKMAKTFFENTPVGTPVIVE